MIRPPFLALYASIALLLCMGCGRAPQHSGATPAPAGPGGDSLPGRKAVIAFDAAVLGSERLVAGATRIRALGEDGQPIGTTFFTRSALARKIPAHPSIDPHSAAMIAAMTGGGIGEMVITPNGLTGTVVATAKATDPLVTITCLEPYGPPPCPIRPTRIAAGTLTGSATDCHNTFIDPADNIVTDSWQTGATGSGSSVQCAGYQTISGASLNNGWGSSGTFTGDGTGFLATGSQLSLVAGIMRADDFLAGVDTHSFFAAVQCSAKGAWVYPAKASDAQGSRRCSGATYLPEYGQYIWLDSGGLAELEALNPVVLYPWFAGMHEYGIVIGDSNEETDGTPQGSDAMSVNIESSRLWRQVVSRIQSDSHRIDTSISGGRYHFVPNLPRDIERHVFVLDKSVMSAP